MSLPRYSKYKDSGVAWLGDVPSTWQTRRAKHLFDIKKRIAGVDGYDVLSITQQGIKVRDVESNDGQLSMDYSKYQLVEVGDFAMNHMDLLTGYVDVSKHFGVTSPDYRVFSIKSNDVSSPRYFLYLLQDGYKRKIFYAFGKGASHFGRWRFPTEEFNSFVFPLPPRDEQIAIASFLDGETGKIDALIAEQEKLLALLAEKRQATVSHAVTRGLNPDAPMTDSGVARLGQVPEHWRVSPLKYLVSLKSGGTPSKENLDFWDGDVPWASAKDLKLERLADTIDHITGLAVESGNATLVPSGTVLVVVRGMILARTFPVVEAVVPMAINQDLKGVIPLEGLSGRFLAWLLRGTADESLLRLDEAGHGTKALRMDAWTSMRLPVPPTDEQSAIADFLERETGKLDALKAEAERAIELLKERRGALIAAGVTGKIDVRNAVPQELAA